MFSPRASARKGPVPKELLAGPDVVAGEEALGLLGDHVTLPYEAHSHLVIAHGALNRASGIVVGALFGREELQR